MPRWLISLFMHENNVEYDIIFLTVFIIGLIGFANAASIKITKKNERSTEKFSPKNLLLKKGIPEACVMTLLTFGYGIVTVYLSIYATKEVGITQGVGYYFSIFSAGLVAARLSSSLLLRGGKYITVFICGVLCLVVAYFLVAFIHNPIAFFGSAIFMGGGYGLISPTVQTMMINLGKDTERGIANATYLTFFDLGVGAGVFFGGIIAQYTSYSTTYAISLIMTIIGLLYLIFFIRPHFKANRLR